MKRLGNILVWVLTFAIVVLVGWIALSRFGVVPPPINASQSTPTGQGNPKNKLAYLSTDDPSIGVEDLGPRKWKIIDIHEHAKSEVEAAELLKAMDKFGIQRTALMASTTYTLTLNPIYGFEGFKENNESIITIKKKWPDRFAAFITFDPCSGEDNLALVKDYVARGADGVKLYLGHGASTPKFKFHCEPIDHENLEPFFAWAEETQLPILMHVNLEKFWDETMHVLEKHPHLRITLPHFGLHKNTDQRLKRLGFLLDRYPNVYTDTSFGYYTFQVDGFEVLAKFRSRSKEFLTRYAKKVMVASDMVLEPSKDEPYILNTLRSYLQFLEKEHWRLFLVPGKTMHGMGLEDTALKQIYEDAPRNFLLIDESGHLPDRTKNPVVTVERLPLPPLTPDMIPPLKLAPGSSSPSPGPGEKDDTPDDGDNKGAGCEHEDAATDDVDLLSF